MSKRLISMLTAFTMLMTMLSGAALAADDTEAFDLAGAIEAAEPGATITLEGEVSLDEAVVINKEVIINLGGFNISMTQNDTAGDGVFHVVAGGDLTINGNGTLNGVGNNNYNMAIWADGGNVTINGGTYTNVGAGEDDHYDLIYAGSSQGAGGHIEINGGTFIAHTTKWTLNTNDTNGSIEVKGGRFYQYNPSDAFSEPTQPKSFVADGYEVTEDDGYYVVSEMVIDSEAELRAAIAEGGVVKLGGNIAITETITVTNDVKLTADEVVAVTSNGNASFQDTFIVTDGGKLTLGRNITITSNVGVIGVEGGTGVIDGAVINAVNPLYNSIYVGSGTLTIEDGSTITSEGANKVTLLAYNEGELVINGGTITSESSSVARARDNATLTVYGGELETTVEDPAFCAAYASNGGVITVYDGVIEAAADKALVATAGGKVIVEGGTVNGVFAHENAAASAEIKDGVINGVIGTDDGASLTVTGGQFENDPSEYVADGYEVSENGGVYVVSEISDEGGSEGWVPSGGDDDDDYVPAPAVSVKDENGKEIKLEKQADGVYVVNSEEFTVDTRDGKDVSVIVPTDGVNYGLVAVVVNEDGSEAVITDTIPGENGIEFTVKDGQKIKIVDKTQVFDDVNEGDWNHDAVTFAAARGIVNGVGNGRFEPGTAATRGMVMTMLARLSGVDTEGGESWFSEGMDWAMKMGISDGTAPEGVITREQLVVMLWRLEGEPKANGGMDGFDDGESVSEWAVQAMAWAVENGIIQGNNGMVMPQGSANRDQVAQILMNYMLSQR